MKGNRGAALVAVLIGILFIAILASSLLYMSSMNFKMKGMRAEASDNFYSAEYAMADMLAQVKQMSYASDDPKTKLSGYLKSGANSVNTGNLQKLIGYGSGNGVLPDIADAKVSCIYDGTGVASYEEIANYIYLRGIKVTTTTKSGYESSIVTDIKIGFPSSSDAPGRLNDFSILSDSPLSLKESSQYFGGDIYVRANTHLGNDALRVGEHSNVTFMGNFCFIDGDLTIQSGGKLYLNGTTYVRGKITVNGSGHLFVGGDLYYRDGKSGNVEVFGGGADKGSGGVKWENYDTYNGGLGNKLVSEYMHVHKSNASSEKDMKYNQKDFRDLCQNGGLNKDDAIVYGDGVSAIYLTNQSNVPDSVEYENCLIISGGCPSMFQGKLTNCTYLCVDKSQVFEIGVQRGSFPWGTMDDASFEKARKLFVKTKTDNGVTMPSSALTVDDLTTIEGDPNRCKLGGITLEKFTNDEDSKPFYFDVSKPNENYFPFDNFLDKEMEKTLREFKGAAGGDDDASAQPMISFSNWSKE
jgi:hypothetical protein